jgi:hypothetical protein
MRGENLPHYTLCKEEVIFPFHHWVKETKRAILGTAEVYEDFTNSSRGFGCEAVT